MRKEFITVVLVMIIIFGFLVFTITSGVSEMNKKTNILKSDCNITNYYTTGDRGSLNQIYECPENAFKNEKD